MKIANVLSVDLEDWYTSAYLRDYADQKAAVPKIVESTKNILGLFSRKKLQATFFVLGMVAERHPELIEEIYNKGHEIASHGYSHNPLWKLSRGQFRDEVRKTNKIIASITGEKPIGFRAPYFSIDKRFPWALPVLEQEGFSYDSSIFPMRTPLYGCDNAPNNPYHPSAADPAKKGNMTLLEFPMPVVNFFGVKIPACGGFYFRLYPEFVTRFFLRKLNSEHKYANIFFHPWESCRDIPRIRVPFKNWFISYYGNRKYLKVVGDLLNEFRFVSFRQWLDENGR